MALPSFYGIHKYSEAQYSTEKTTRSLVKRPKMRVYRTFLMRRRELDGEYESAWQTIPSFYVRKFSSVSHGVSDIRANFFKYSGFNIQLSNLDGFFNNIDDEDSFFSGKLNIYRTLVRVDAGYIDDNDVKTPTSGTLFVGVVGEGFKWTEDRSLDLQCDHLSSIFDEFPSDRVAGLGSTQTASDMIGRFRDHADSNSVAIFQKYISTPAWNIDTTTVNYDIATSTALQGKTVWAVMKDLASAENKQLYMAPNGDFHFEDRATPSTISWHFSGANDRDNTYGKSILGAFKLDQKIRDVYNRIVIKHGDEDTITSFLFKQEEWNWGDDSSSFQYGVRTYNYPNVWLNTSTASTVADTIFNQFQFPSDEVKLRAKFLPELAIGDRVTVTHKNGVYSGVAVYGQAVFGTDVFGVFKKGSVDILRKPFKITRISHNLARFTTSVVMREIV